MLASGLVEITLGAALIGFARGRVSVGLLTAAFFVAIFPGNIAQYLDAKDAFGLDTDQKRLVRLFFQPVLVLGAVVYRRMARPPEPDKVSQPINGTTAA